MLSKSHCLHGDKEGSANQNTNRHDPSTTPSTSQMSLQDDTAGSTDQNFSSPDSNLNISVENSMITTLPAALLHAMWKKAEEYLESKKM